jgi:hypothetical protein
MFQSSSTADTSEVHTFESLAPDQAACSGCSGEPFMTTAEVAAVMSHAGGRYCQRGVTFTNKVAGAVGLRASNEAPFSDAADAASHLPPEVAAPPSLHTALYTIRSTPRARGNAALFACAGNNTRHKLSAKIALMHQYAEGLAKLHASGYAHLNISLQSLMIETDAPPRGFIAGFGIAAAIPRVVAGATGPAVTYSRLARGTIAFRAPETFFEYSAERAMPGCSETAADRKVTTLSAAADVWALGVAYLAILTESDVFRIARGRPFMSLRGTKRVAALEGSGASLAEIERETAIECVRWQTYRLFGVAALSGRGVPAEEVNAGNTRRRVNIAVMLGGAVERGILGRREASAMQPMIVGMLSPYVPLRSTAADVAQSKAFSASAEWSSRVVGRAIHVEPAPASRQAAPIGGWTAAKDSAVVGAIREAVKAGSTAHLPAEAVFTAFDCAARVVAGIPPPEPAGLLTAGAAAAVRVALLLYDLAPSIASFGSSVASEHSGTRALEPYVVQYLAGDLRRADYFYDMAAESAGMLTAAFDLLVSRESADAAAFRAAYLTLDTVSYVRNTLLPAVNRNAALRARSAETIVTMYDLARSHENTFGRDAAV